MRQLAARVASCAILSALPAIAHDDEEGMNMDMGISISMTKSSSASPSASSLSTQLTSPNLHCEEPMSYFACGIHSGPIMAHIALMIVGWCFVLPAAVMFSVACSRFALPSQLLFLIFNTFGLALGIVYNAQTPDLYENNVHHKIGWVATWVISIQVILALLFRYNRRGESKLQSASFERAAFLPVATNEEQSSTPTEAASIHEYCWSHESSQESTSALSVQSFGPPSFESQNGCERFDKPEVWYLSGLHGWLNSIVVDRFVSKIPTIFSTNALHILNGTYIVIDRIILLLGFIAIVTGAVTYGGIFRGNDVFNGLAHFIKGGIFFWYGVLTLGRFIGAWADLGWAWNEKPPASVVGWKAKVPSGEFVESFVIWLYGVTNVFLEHLSNWGGAWSATDMEHVSISIMFFGGGLAGMLFESKRIRDALNSTLLRLPYETQDEKWQPPRSQGVPLNPMPALIILLLGTMMGSHHQDSMTSTMVHKQWGNLLVGFALARGMTYVLFFLRPPTSYLPSRPPTEIISGFCLIAGGIVFMLSSRNVIETMEFYDVDAMFTFTVAMGFTAFIMCLVISNIAIKAWAVKSKRLLHKKRGFALESRATST